MAGLDTQLISNRNLYLQKDQKMKKITFFIILSALFSCKKEAKLNATNKKLVPEISVKESHQELYGSWVGDFVDASNGDDLEIVETDGYSYSNKINIVIKRIAGDHVVGQSIVAGNVRPIQGTLSESNSQLKFVLQEPGDDKNDGKFEFEWVNDSIKGLWHSNNPKAIVKVRAFKLAKQEFKYDPTLMLPADNEYVDYYTKKPQDAKEKVENTEDMDYSDVYRSASEAISILNSSTTVLKEQDLKNLKKLDLEILRNTIFARHGYTFKKISYRQFFDPIDWYVPVSNDVSADLTIVEKDNIKILQRFEKYAEDNYDYFGR
jgi:hypothetical protein